MNPLTESTIRSSLVNASQRERASLTLPPEFAALDWEARDFFGWRDPKLPKLGYAYVDLDGETIGVLLREADGRIRTRPQCSWCGDVTLPNDVVFFSAKRSGPAGRRGDTIGTLVCAAFQCSANARKRPPVAYIGFDVEAARQERIAALHQHVRGFIRDVRDGG